METLKQRKKEEREKEKQTGDQAVNEVQVQLDKMKAETKARRLPEPRLPPHAPRLRPHAPMLPPHARRLRPHAPRLHPGVSNPACDPTYPQVMLNQIKQESKVRVQNITADGNLKVTRLRPGCNPESPSLQPRDVCPSVHPWAAQVTQLNQEKDQKLTQLRSEAQVAAAATVCTQHAMQPHAIQAAALSTQLATPRVVLQAEAERIKAETELFESTKLSEANLTKARAGLEIASRLPRDCLEIASRLPRDCPEIASRSPRRESATPSAGGCGPMCTVAPPISRRRTRAMRQS